MRWQTVIIVHWYLVAVSPNNIPGEWVSEWVEFNAPPRHSHSVMAKNGLHSRSWELDYGDHRAKYVNSHGRIDDWTFAEDFSRLFDTSFRKRNAKKLCFFRNLEKINSDMYSSRSRRPSFEYAGLICYTQISPSLFHCFTLSSKPTFS